MGRKPKHPTFDIDMVRAAASHRWPEILSHVGGIDRELLDGEHHGCPKPNCGGTDRFRMIDASAGALFCNQCFRDKNGDGFAAVQWLLDVKFPDALAKVAEYLGIEASASTDNKAGKQPSKNGKPAKERKRYATLYDAALAVYAGLIKDAKSPATLVTAWLYEDTSGAEQFAAARFNTIEGKTFRPFHRDGESWVIGDPAGTKIPLYELQSLAAADVVYVVEGEKCADVARELGLIATTSAHGSKSPHLTDWSPLAGKRVIILPDNDTPGETYACEVARILTTLPKPATVTLRRLPGLGPGGDIDDFALAGRNNAKANEEMRAEIEALADEIPGKPAPPEVNEADDDPHRLARVNLERYGMHSTGATLRYWRDEWYTWKPSRGCYRRIGTEELRAKLNAAIKAEFDRLNVEALAAFREREKAGQTDEGDMPPQAKKVTKTLVTNVLDATKSLTVVPSSIELMTWLDDDGSRERRNYVAMKNGVLDLDALIADQDEYMLPHSAKWFSTVSLPFPFDPEADCPRWKAILEHNLDSDQQLIASLQEWAGYLLLPDTGQQRFLLMEGEGSNGKGVYMAAMTAMLGQDNVSNVSLEVFGDRFSRTDTIGKLANVCGDCEELDKVAEGYIKSFTSGDRMYFDRKGVSGINCVPTARLMIACNERPRFRDRSNGIWRRVLLIPWKREIEESMKVRNMDKADWWERSGELPGILNWAVAGLHRLRQQGRFTDAEASREAKADYQSEMNSARAFLAEFVEEANPLEGDSPIRADFLYGLYSKWARHGNQHPFAKPTFGKEVFRRFKSAKKGQFREFGNHSTRRRHTAYKYLRFTRDEICGESTEDATALSSSEAES